MKPQITASNSFAKPIVSNPNEQPSKRQRIGDAGARSNPADGHETSLIPKQHSASLQRITTSDLFNQAGMNHPGLRASDQIHLPEIVVSAVLSPESFDATRLPDLMTALDQNVQIDVLTFDELANIRSIVLDANRDELNDDLNFEEELIEQTEQAFRLLSIATDPDSRLPHSFAGPDTKLALDDHITAIKDVLNSDELNTLATRFGNENSLNEEQLEELTNTFITSYREKWSASVGRHETPPVHNFKLDEITPSFASKDPDIIARFRMDDREIQWNTENTQTLPNALLTLAHELFHGVQEQALITVSESPSSPLKNSDLFSSVVFSRSWMLYLGARSEQKVDETNDLLNEECSTHSLEEVQAYSIEKEIAPDISRLVGTEKWELFLPEVGELYGVGFARKSET